MTCALSIGAVLGTEPLWLWQRKEKYLHLSGIEVRLSSQQAFTILTDISFGILIRKLDVSDYAFLWLSVNSWSASAISRYAAGGQLSSYASVARLYLQISHRTIK
jgi:hypothetical protein